MTLYFLFCYEKFHYTSAGCTTLPEVGSGDDASVAGAAGVAASVAGVAASVAGAAAAGAFAIVSDNLFNISTALFCMLGVRSSMYRFLDARRIKRRGRSTSTFGTEEP